MKFLPVNVYRWSLGDCTHGGISAKENTLYVRHPEGIYTEDEVRPELRFTAENRGGHYWAIYPDVKPANAVGPMFGGNLAMGDSRHGDKVYRIHDRFETQAECDALSR